MLTFSVYRVTECSIPNSISQEWWTYRFSLHHNSEPGNHIVLDCLTRKIIEWHHETHLVKRKSISAIMLQLNEDLIFSIFQALVIGIACWFLKAKLIVQWEKSRAVSGVEQDHQGMSERLQVEWHEWRTDLSDCLSTDFSSDERAVVFGGGRSLHPASVDISLHEVSVSHSYKPMSVEMGCSELRTVCV